MTQGEADQALLELLERLNREGYVFVCPTPATHARVLFRRSPAPARSLTDVLGWSLPFAMDEIDPTIAVCLRAADMLKSQNGLWKSLVRVSTLHGRLYLHSAYPTQDRDSVFFGPDSYRFADLIASELAVAPPPEGALTVDIGAGAGVGGMTVMASFPTTKVVMTDINPTALRLARINAAAAGLEVRTVEASGLQAVHESIDLAVCNPPYIIDTDGPAYRNGGAMHGAELSLELACQAADRLAPAGRLILYTGSAIVGGQDRLYAALADAMRARAYSMRYREIDPDVFGEELDNVQYADVDRIALVAAVIERPARS